MNRLSTIDEERYEVEGKSMAAIVSSNNGEGSGDVQPYSMHVSAKYLELTRRKLELTRLPREISLPEDSQWKLGTPKSELEPLIDFWLEKYDWRGQEAQINAHLPQFRTSIEIPDSSSTTTGVLSNTGEGKSEKLRVHFVHKRSSDPNAIPLLFCHTWPGSFLDILPLIEPLTTPISIISTATAQQNPATQLSHTTFHVVCPSIPGFGFSDASESESLGAKETAVIFDSLMKKLGYAKYVVHGSGWGWPIARHLALHHSSSCLAAHTNSPRFPQPQYTVNARAWWKWRLAVLTGTRIPWLSGGYTPSDIKHWPSKTAAPSTDSKEGGEDLEKRLTHHPQTPSFALCDSPPGLLAAILDILHSHSALLPPPVTILNNFMLTWLPGPESVLRWLHSTISSSQTLYQSYSSVPLGVSSFSWEVEENGPVLWAEGWQNLVWCRKRHGSVAVYAVRSGEGRRNDRDAELVADLRDFVGVGVRQGWVEVRTPREEV